MRNIRLFASLAYSLVLVGYVVGLVPRPLPTPPPLAPPSRLELAVATLRSAPRFNAAQIGFAGITPPEVLAWRLVEMDITAIATFQDLIRNGTPAGKLYALAGLRRRDAEIYETARSSVVQSNVRVEVTVGCVVSLESVQTIVKEIDTGRWTREFLSGRLLSR